MGVHVLVGTADGTSHAAAMYDSASGWTVGPVWETPDAEEQIEAFLDWMRRESYVGLAERVGLESDDLPNPIFPSTYDPRVWPDHGLAKLVAYWRSVYVGEDGLLLDPPPA